MTTSSKRDVLEVFHARYAKTSWEKRGKVLDEFCSITGYHRKYAIRLLNRALVKIKGPRGRKRRPTYGPHALEILEHIWAASGYPWSIRLKAILPLWLVWARKHFKDMTKQIEREILTISARQMDRRLRGIKVRLGRRLYGRTKPGSLLKHHISIRTDNWDIHEPGFVEVDLVSHSGDSASGEFIYSLNLTDIHTTWVETYAVMGRSEVAVLEVLVQMRKHLPFPLKGIDSDNGSEFINSHLYRYCHKEKIQFTRSRPYKKDDNAHIEQKNWTHVRKLLGWERYDSPGALQVINALYRGELRLMMNLFQPSVKLVSKERIGARLRRLYDPPQTPLDRLVAFYGDHPSPQAVRDLLARRRTLDPFSLSDAVGSRLERVWSSCTPSKARNEDAGGRTRAPLNGQSQLQSGNIPAPLFR